MAHATRPKNEFALIYRTGKGYAVTAPNGAIVSGWTTRPQAEMTRESKQRAADAAKGKRERPCMCCARPFRSDGIHNRLCHLHLCRRNRPRDGAQPSPAVGHRDGRVSGIRHLG